MKRQTFNEWMTANRLNESYDDGTFEWDNHKFDGRTYYVLGTIDAEYEDPQPRPGPAGGVSILDIAIEALERVDGDEPVSPEELEAVKQDILDNHEDALRAYVEEMHR